MRLGTLGADTGGGGSGRRSNLRFFLDLMKQTTATTMIATNTTPPQEVPTATAITGADGDGVKLDSTGN